MNIVCLGKYTYTSVRPVYTLQSTMLKGVRLIAKTQCVEILAEVFSY